MPSYIKWIAIVAGVTAGMIGLLLLGANSTRLLHSDTVLDTMATGIAATFTAVAVALGAAHSLAIRAEHRQDTLVTELQQRDEAIHQYLTSVLEETRKQHDETIEQLTAQHTEQLTELTAAVRSATDRAQHGWWEGYVRGHSEGFSQRLHNGPQPGPAADTRPRPDGTTGARGRRPHLGLAPD